MAEAWNQAYIPDYTASPYGGQYRREKHKSVAAQCNKTSVARTLVSLSAAHVWALCALTMTVRSTVSSWSETLTSVHEGRPKLKYVPNRNSIAKYWKLINLDRIVNWPTGRYTPRALKWSLFPAFKFCLYPRSQSLYLKRHAGHKV
jgi:hypothetical protein